MLRKYWDRKPRVATHSSPTPACVVMWGQISNSPEPRAVASRITLAPMSLPRGTGSGSSLTSSGGRFLVGSFQPSADALLLMVSVMPEPSLSPNLVSHVIGTVRSCQSASPTYLHPFHLRVARGFDGPSITVIGCGREVL